ncbi:MULTISPECIES: hypothetical protein [Actinoalloteichus]|uniref:PPE family domain-containing protein n=1 Tax=Actinoalloteichus fjordicus TaxID=1612552 RepID=A0AAC9LKB1_9PSEU|nr:MULTISPECIES: hypothetical protein [Actinoalloteichus]APU17845.1 hypothetical protein UA74_29265 [Actinoalloteichus fjordicus]APU23923.1 hypothetical protein UA75_29795 [Actinoalloteichus sp. GBA129-24]
MTATNWDGIAHQQLVDWFRAGSTDSATASAVRWREHVGGSLGRVAELVDGALRDGGAVWHGAAAEAMRDGVSPLARFALDAQDASVRIGTGVDQWVAAFEHVTRELPAPIRVTDDEAWRDQPVAALLGTVTDREAVEGQAREAEERARALARAYERTVGTTIDELPLFAPALPAGAAGTDRPPGASAPHPPAPAAGLPAPLGQPDARPGSHAAPISGLGEAARRAGPPSGPGLPGRSPHTPQGTVTPYQSAPQHPAAPHPSPSYSPPGMPVPGHSSPAPPAARTPQAQPPQGPIPPGPAPQGRIPQAAIWHGRGSPGATPQARTHSGPATPAPSQAAPPSAGVGPTPGGAVPGLPRAGSGGSTHTAPGARNRAVAPPATASHPGTPQATSINPPAPTGFHPPGPSVAGPASRPPAAQPPELQAPMPQAPGSPAAPPPTQPSAEPTLAQQFGPEAVRQYDIADSAGGSGSAGSSAAPFQPSVLDRPAWGPDAGPSRSAPRSSGHAHQRERDAPEYLEPVDEMWGDTGHAAPAVLGDELFDQR